jgi:hypothetical protein
MDFVQPPRYPPLTITTDKIYPSFDEASAWDLLEEQGDLLDRLGELNPDGGRLYLSVPSRNSFIGNRELVIQYKETMDKLDEWVKDMVDSYEESIR